MGLNSPKFTTLHSGDIKVMKLNFAKYLKDLGSQRRFLLQKLVSESEGASDCAKEVPRVTITAKGFPVLPDVNFATQTQDNLADMMRQYLSKHYSMFMVSMMTMPHC